MPTKAQIKFIKSLHQKKYRRKYKKFIAETPKIVRELMQYQKYSIETLFASKEWIDSNKDMLKGSGLKVELSSNKELNSMTALKNANEVMALCDLPDDNKDLLDSRKNEWAVYLDNINDPGNMGTIIRTADWFGINTVIKSSNAVDFYNPKVIQASMGSLFHLNVCESSFGEVMSHYSNRYALTLNGDNIYNISATPGLIIVGSESHGIKDEIISNSTKNLTIPLRGRAESLNAASAFAIACSTLVQN